MLTRNCVSVDIELRIRCHIDSGWSTRRCSLFAETCAWVDIKEDLSCADVFIKQISIPFLDFRISESIFYPEKERESLFSFFKPEIWNETFRQKAGKGKACCLTIVLQIRQVILLVRVPKLLVYSVRL